MFRFLILLLGMVTTRAGRLETGSFRGAGEDEWEEPGPWLDGPGYAADDTWIVARESQPPAQRQREAAGPRPGRRNQISGKRRRLVPRWVKWTVVLALVGLVFRKAIAFAVLVTLSGALHLIGYDHQRAADARRMERREIAVLRRLGFANPYR